MTAPRRFTLEVVCETAADAEAAAAGGADRVELCAALEVGGLTPSAGQFHAAREAGLPAWVMIRPRPGDFVYTESELAVMVRDVEAFRPANPAGFVFGALDPDGRVNRDACRRLLDACGGTPAVFHRAFDRTPSLSESLETVVELGFKRVLTSGREDTALAGAKVIGRLREKAAGRVEILPCGRVRADALETLLWVTGCDQFHGSFAVPVPVRDGVGYRGYPARTRVGREQVAAARAELDRLAAVVPHDR